MMVVSKYSSRIRQNVLSSNEIRSRFINFFKSQDHILVKSSSVQPFADPSLEFVNAGMNQFKNVFLGMVEPPVSRAVNSQKCIRVGGKHNDLDVVGHDSYHHTFFEMLGNWSFGNYFKKEACSFALELVTSKPYSLPLNRLYFTYFHGEKSLNLPPDLETKELWRQLGICEERIIGFGLKDNFWEMGSTGPCGPCTEIHYDHIGSAPRPHLVNADLPDLTELWNLVFIQFNRQEDGSLSELSQTYVDTGMGLERLVALLQGKRSNYDSDLFTPLFKTISKIAQVPEYRGRYGKDDVEQLDTRYRILADHSRMVAVSLSDYILPDYSHSLRRVIRKSLLVANSLLPDSGLQLLLAVVESAANSLHNHFPQVLSNFKQAEMILKDETTLFKEVRKDTQSAWAKLISQDGSLASLTDCQSVGLIEAYKYLKRNPDSTAKLLDPDQALVCYDRFGLNISLIEQLANIKGYTVDRVSFDRAVGRLKEYNKSLVSGSPQTKEPTICLSDLKYTDDSARFDYFRDSIKGTYFIQKLMTKVERAWIKDQILKEGQQVFDGSNIRLVLCETNFHSPLRESGNPLGYILLTTASGQEAKLTVFQTRRLYGRVIHEGIISSICESNNEVLIYDQWNAECTVNIELLENLFRNTTAALLIESILKSKFLSSMTYFNNNSDIFTARFLLYGQSFSVKDALVCEKEVNDLILSGRVFNGETISAKTLLSDYNIPNPPYLSNNLVSYQLLSSQDPNFKLNAVTENPNILNSKDISQICLTRFHLAKRNRECTLCGVTGPDIWQKFNKPTIELINNLQSCTNKDEGNDLIKQAKGLLQGNRIPLELQQTLKKSMEDLKMSTKKMKIRR